MATTISANQKENLRVNIEEKLTKCIVLLKSSRSFISFFHHKESVLFMQECTKWKEKKKYVVELLGVAHIQQTLIENINEKEKKYIVYDRYGKHV